MNNSTLSETARQKLISSIAKKLPKYQSDIARNKGVKQA